MQQRKMGPPIVGTPFDTRHRYIEYAGMNSVAGSNLEPLMLPVMIVVA
jgi:hypothetical protein